MRGYYRRRSAVTWTVWCAAFLFLCGMLAWQFHWLPGSAPDESPVDGTAAGTDSKTAAKKSGEPADLHKPSSSPDPFIAERQSEPDEFTLPERFRGSEPGGRLSVPRRFPGETPETAEPPRKFTGTIVGVDGEALPASSYRSRTAGPPRDRFHSAGNNRGRMPEDPAGRVSDSSYGAVPSRSARNGRDDVPPRRSAVRQVGLETMGKTADDGPPTATLAKIDGLRDRGDYLAAHKLLSRMYWDKPQWRKAIRRRLEMTARTIYFDSRVHLIKPYTVQPGERLATIAKKYRVSWQYLARLNDMAPTPQRAARLRAGERLKVIKGPFSAVVDLSDREITIHHYGYFVCRFPVGIGKDGRTPLGKFKVEDKVEDPPYTGTDERTGRRYRIAPDDPRNPLGKRWISIGNSYGIHGTIDESSIGKAESRGCIRMHNKDVEWVYDLLTPGSEVVIQR